MTIKGFNYKHLEALKKHNTAKKALKDINVDMKNDKVLIAYPNYDYYMETSPPRDTKKWMQAVRDMYYKVHKGVDKGEALENIIAGWDKMEKLNFKDWLKYYEEGAHKKYKTAQLVSYWEAPERPGYFIPNYPNAPQQQQDQNHAKGIEEVQQRSSHPDINADEKRQIIEKQRLKIIGRLDSAEKLLRSEEGQIFAGKELETLLDVIYSLKKKIQMVNKLSLSTRLYDDMIVREANILSKRGFVKAGAMLHKVAQDAMPPATEPSNPASGGGLPVGGRNEGPGLTPPPGPEDPTTVPTTEPAPKPVSEGMSQFLEALETNNDTTVEDMDEEVATEDDNLEVTDADDLEVTAQALPPVPPPELRKNPPPKPETPLEVTEDEPDTKMNSTNFNDKIDQVFANISVEDAIAEFEFISNFYKAREIPRRLSRADMMLDSLGLASFFPSLAEAQNKALESNNYISSRVEEILSKLRGSIKTQDVELSTGDKAPRPEVEGIKRKLQDDETKEKARKQMRKDLENEALTPSDKVTPEVEVAEDLATPAKLQGRPAAPPPAPRPVPVR